MGRGSLAVGDVGFKNEYPYVRSPNQLSQFDIHEMLVDQ